MTREEAKKLLPVIQAYVDGKTIEIRSVDGTDDWEETDNPHFDFSTFEYRIKQEPTYRPFANAEECWNEMLKHQPFGWVKSKGNGSYTLLTHIDTSWTYIQNKKAYESNFDIFTFVNGQPFGVKVEE